MRRSVLMFFFLQLFIVAGARASLLSVSGSGVFSATTPTTSYSAPGVTFAYSFVVDNHPVVSNVAVTDSFSPAIANFTYTLNGVTTSPLATGIEMYNLINDAGLFDICFATACSGDSISGVGLEFAGPQVYSGSEASPTILPGIYMPASVYFVDGGIETALKSAGPISIAATPEPSSIALLGSGLLAASAVIRRQRS